MCPSSRSENILGVFPGRIKLDSALLKWPCLFAARGEKDQKTPSLHEAETSGEADGDNGERFREQREEVGERDIRCGDTEASP